MLGSFTQLARSLASRLLILISRLTSVAVVYVFSQLKENETQLRTSRVNTESPIVRLKIAVIGHHRLQSSNHNVKVRSIFSHIFHVHSPDTEQLILDIVRASYPTFIKFKKESIYFPCINVRWIVKWQHLLPEKGQKIKLQRVSSRFSILKMKLGQRVQYNDISEMGYFGHLCKERR